MAIYSLINKIIKIIFLLSITAIDVTPFYGNKVKIET